MSTNDKKLILEAIDSYKDTIRKDLIKLRLNNNERELFKERVHKLNDIKRRIVIDIEKGDLWK